MRREEHEELGELGWVGQLSVPIDVRLVTTVGLWLSRMLTMQGRTEPTGASPCPAAIESAPAGRDACHPRVAGGPIEQGGGQPGSLQGVICRSEAVWATVTATVVLLLPPRPSVTVTWKV